MQIFTGSHEDYHLAALPETPETAPGAGAANLEFRYKKQVPPPRLGIQPRNRLAPDYAAGGREALVVHRAAGEADQNRGEGGLARQAGELSEGRAGGAHELFARILERIQRLGVPPPVVQRG